MNARKLPPHLAEAARSATSVGKSATSLAPAPNQRAPEVPIVAVTVEEAEAEAEAETTMLSVVEARRPGIVNR